jgi:hypothetical protein
VTAGGFAGTFDLARDAHAPERGEIALLEHDPSQGRAEEYFERALTVAPQQQQLC